MRRVDVHLSRFVCLVVAVSGRVAHLISQSSIVARNHVFFPSFVCLFVARSATRLCPSSPPRRRSASATSRCCRRRLRRKCNFSTHRVFDHDKQSDRRRRRGCRRIRSRVNNSLRSGFVTPRAAVINARRSLEMSTILRLNACCWLRSTVGRTPVFGR